MMKSATKSLIKSNDQIQIMREGGKILSEILYELIKNTKIGVCGLDIEKISLSLCQKYDVRPAFLNFNGYPYATCISINSVVVHGLPSRGEFKNDDIVSIDFGIIYKNFNLDAARSIYLSKKENEKSRFVEITKKSFYEGIKNIKEGSYTGDIGNKVETYAKKYNCGVIRDLCGHGIGKNLQEEPNIFNYGKIGSGVRLEKGMTLAIEPMLTLGGEEIKVATDGFSIITQDNSISCHWENTVLVTKTGIELLTHDIY